MDKMRIPIPEHENPTAILVGFLLIAIGGLLLGLAIMGLIWWLT